MQAQVIFFYFHEVHYFLRAVKFQSPIHININAGDENTALQFHKAEF